MKTSDRMLLKTSPVSAILLYIELALVLEDEDEQRFGHMIMNATNRNSCLSIISFLLNYLHNKWKTKINTKTKISTFEIIRF